MNAIRKLGTRWVAAACGAGSTVGIVVTEVTGDPVLARIWYVVASFCWSLVVVSVIPRKQQSATIYAPKASDVTEIIYRQDVATHIAGMEVTNKELSTHIESLSSAITEMTTELKDMLSLLTNVFGTPGGRDSPDGKLSIVGGTTTRRRPSMPPVIGVQKRPPALPTTVREQVVVSPEPLVEPPTPSAKRSSVAIPKIHKIEPLTVKPAADELSDDESDKIDQLLADKPVIAMQSLKSSATDDMDHYPDGDIDDVDEKGSDPDSEE
jgi:hypothetical protein